MRLTKKQVHDKLDTPEGIAELANLMVGPLRKHYGLPEPEVKKKKQAAKTVTLVDIEGKVLRVGQRVVFCERASETDLDTGIIEKVSPQSIYIKRDCKDMRSSMDRQMGNSPKAQYYSEKGTHCTKRLITTYSKDGNDGYNRIEVYII